MLVVKMLFGSHLYGTETKDSDTDYKGIYIPSAREIILHNYAKTITTGRDKAACERNVSTDTDMELFSLDRYLELLMEGQTVAIDMLFAPDNMIVEQRNPVLWQDIKNRKHEFLTKNINAFVGYAKQQAAKYGIKGSRLDALKRTMELLEKLPANDKLSSYEQTLFSLVSESNDLVSLELTPLIEIVHLNQPNNTLLPHLHVCGRKVPFSSSVKIAKKIFGRILNEYGARAHKAHLAGGIDWKALSHAVRVNSEAQELLTTGIITFPCQNRELLKQIKTGQLPYEQVAELIEQGVADLHAAHSVSSLREKPNKELANEFVFNIYSDVVRDSI